MSARFFRFSTQNQNPNRKADRAVRKAQRASSYELRNLGRFGEELNSTSDTGSQDFVTAPTSQVGGRSEAGTQGPLRGQNPPTSQAHGPSEAGPSHQTSETTLLPEDDSRRSGSTAVARVDNTTPVGNGPPLLPPPPPPPPRTGTPLHPTMKTRGRDKCPCYDCLASFYQRVTSMEMTPVAPPPGAPHPATGTAPLRRQGYRSLCCVCYSCWGACYGPDGLFTNWDWQSTCFRICCPWCK
jgi:hypothetical protein